MIKNNTNFNVFRYSEQIKKLLKKIYPTNKLKYSKKKNIIIEKRKEKHSRKLIVQSELNVN
jgi:hypothetical protein